jgi:YHS domain-containing protein
VIVMKARMMFLAAAVLAVAVVSIGAEEKADLSKIKCPVSNRAVNPEAAVDYKGGKAYFCCMNCPKAFADNTAKFAAKANAQLVATGQAAQAKCPISGRDLNDETAIEVAGAKVVFCCNNCKGRVERAEGDAKVELAFGEEAFKKAGFKVKAEK